MTDFKLLVEDLLSKKKEGDYWDYKLIHHENHVDLIKDIICLANVNWNSDRYIIYGVNDSFEITGIRDTDKRRTQSDIISILRDAKFARDIFPDIYLYNISELDIDLLVIKNKQEKPYFLSETNKFKGKVINAGVIFSRIRDTNTPSNKTANYERIAYMWKEQFGLIDNPVIRMENLLSNSMDWVLDIGNKKYGYNINFPEFNIVFGESKKIDSDIGSLFANPTTFEGNIEFKYHTTILFERLFLGVDEFREIYPSPEIGIIDKNYMYYYYQLDNRIGKILSFLINSQNNNLRFRPVRPFVLLKNENEKIEFEEYVKKNHRIMDDIEPSHNLKEKCKQLGRETPIILHKTWIMYKNWKKF